MGTSSLFWRKLILLTTLTPLSGQFLTYLIITNSESHHCITLLDEFREECAFTAIGREQGVFDLNKHFEYQDLHQQHSILKIVGYSGLAGQANKPFLNCKGELSFMAT